MSEARATLTIFDHLAAFLRSGSCCMAGGSTHSRRIDLLAERYMEMVAALVAQANLSEHEMTTVAAVLQEIPVRGVRAAELLPAAVRRAARRNVTEDGTFAYKLERMDGATLLAIVDACERRQAHPAVTAPSESPTVDAG